MAARQWEWTGHEDAVAVAAATNFQKSTIVGAGNVPIVKGSTIARIIGNVVVQKAVSSTGVPKFGMGIILLEAGNTTPPDPLVDYDVQWMYHQTGWLPPFDGSGDFGATRFAIDIHGMRKIMGNQALFFIFGPDPSVALSYQYGVRVGVKLA